MKMKMPTEPCKIGEVSRLLRISERRIREYERAGLIRPEREITTGDRLFNERDIRQIRVIRQLLNQQHYTLKALRQLLQYAPCWELTDCAKRFDCPAFQNPHIPCYEHRQAGVKLMCEIDCQRCPIYQSKQLPRPAIIFDTPMKNPDDV